MSMDRVRSVLLCKSESGNHIVTNFLGTMTAEQKAQYDARQAEKSPTDKRRRELMLQELANEIKAWSVNHTTYGQTSRAVQGGQRKELRDCGRAQQVDAAGNPAALAASSHEDGGLANFHRHVIREGSSELAECMGGGSGDKGASKDLPGGSGSGMGSRQVGSSEGGSPLTRSDPEAVDGSDGMIRLTANPNHLVVDTLGQYNKLLVVLAWLSDTSVGWSEMVRRMKASMTKDRFKGGS
jgi:hypothetical protein